MSSSTRIKSSSIASSSLARVVVKVEGGGKVGASTSVDVALREFGKMARGQSKGISPEKCARKMIRAMKRNRKDVLIGGPELVMVWIHKYCKWLYYRLVNRITTN